MNHFARLNAFVDGGWIGKLNPIEVGVWLAYHRHADDEGLSFPGTRRIGRYIGHASDDHIRRARKRLVDLRLLAIEKAGGGAAPSVYRVLTPPTESAGGRIGGEAESAGPPPTESAGLPPTESAGETTHRTTQLTTQRPAGFIPDPEADIDDQVNDFLRAATFLIGQPAKTQQRMRAIVLQIGWPRALDLIKDVRQDRAVKFPVDIAFSRLADIEVADHRAARAAKPVTNWKEGELPDGLKPRLTRPAAVRAAVVEA